MGDDSEANEGAVEVFGIHRLPLAAGTPSGYLGVRQVGRKGSKKPRWQPWIHVKGEKRRCLGTFRTPKEAAVARARAFACGVETLPSPTKEASRTQFRCCCVPPTYAVR